MITASSDWRLIGEIMRIFQCWMKFSSWNFGKLLLVRALNEPCCRTRAHKFNFNCWQLRAEISPNVQTLWSPEPQVDLGFAEGHIIFSLSPPTLVGKSGWWWSSPDRLLFFEKFGAFFAAFEKCNLETEINTNEGEGRDVKCLPMFDPWCEKYTSFLPRTVAKKMTGETPEVRSDIRKPREKKEREKERKREKKREKMFGSIIILNFFFKSICQHLISIIINLHSIR